jgi:hypothetical protein
MREHERFEVWCALAVSGQLTECELSELRLHIAQCIDCRSRLQGMAQVSALALLPHGVGRAKIPAGMEERFIWCAQANGIPLQRMRSGSPERLKVFFYRYGALAAAILLATLAAANLFKEQVHAPLPGAVVALPQQLPPASVTDADPERGGSVTKVLHKGRRREAATVAARPFSLQHADMHAREARIRTQRSHQDASSLPGPQGGARTFHYDPLAGDVPRQISSVRFHVDWYRVWMEAQENPKRLEISFQPEWKAGIVP